MYRKYKVEIIFQRLKFTLKKKKGADFFIGKLAIRVFYLMEAWQASY